MSSMWPEKVATMRRISLLQGRDSGYHRQPQEVGAGGQSAPNVIMRRQPGPGLGRLCRASQTPAWLGWGFTAQPPASKGLFTELDA